MTDMEMLLVEERLQTNPTHLDSSAAAKSPPPRALITATTFDAPATRGGGGFPAALPGGATPQPGGGAGARECREGCSYSGRRADQELESREIKKTSIKCQRPRLVKFSQRPVVKHTELRCRRRCNEFSLFDENTNAVPCS